MFFIVIIQLDDHKSNFPDHQFVRFINIQHSNNQNQTSGF